MISISLWGEKPNEDNWGEWYVESKKIGEEMGLKMTHLGINSTNYSSSKIMTITRKEKEILSAIENGEQVDSLSVCALPKDYKSASFDYDIYFVRTKSYISVVMKEEFYNQQIENEIVVSMKQYIKFDSGEVFSTSDEEAPLIYTATRNSNNLDTYEKIRVL